MRISKKQVEQITREANLKEAKRLQMRGFDLLISDGFSLPPHRNFRRLGLDAFDFPKGCYVTMWWLMKGEENMFAGHAVFFDAFHDPEYDLKSKKTMRINTAFDEAKNFLMGLEKQGTEHRAVH